MVAVAGVVAAALVSVVPSLPVSAPSSVVSAVVSAVPAVAAVASVSAGELGGSAMLGDADPDPDGGTLAPPPPESLPLTRTCARPRRV